MKNCKNAMLTDILAFWIFVFRLTQKQNCDILLLLAGVAEWQTRQT